MQTRRFRDSGSGAHRSAQVGKKRRPNIQRLLAPDIRALLLQPAICRFDGLVTQHLSPKAP